MKRFQTTLIGPTLLLVLSLGAFGVVNAGPATAVSAHAAKATTKWHGKVTRINATMGATHSFNFEGAHMKIYVVHYDAMTKFTMGTRKDVKVGGPISVTGTLKGKTITATAIDL